MSRYQRISLFLAVVVGIVGLATSTASADAPDPGAFVAVEPASVPDVAGLAGVTVIDEAEYATISEVTQRITPHIYVDGDGMPHLALVSAEEVGVDEAFLDDFRRAMAFANKAIAEGHIQVAPDLTVTPGDGLPAVAPGIGFSVRPVGGEVAASVLPIGDPTVDWQTWQYPQGAMFYNSYPDYWNIYYNRYYVLCNSMAASMGYPWMSQNLIYFYTYNQSYFRNYCYQNYGTYYYLPYHTSCQPGYNPCYGTGVNYRPVYFWVRSYSYNYGCRCYQHTWGWQGYWGRY